MTVLMVQLRTQGPEEVRPHAGAHRLDGRRAASPTFLEALC